MPNWNDIVRARLAVLRLPPERELEIVEEIALHLEAKYDDALLNGLSEAEAQARAVNSYDWHLLECELSRVEHRWQPPITTIEWLERKGGMRMESVWQDLRFGARMLMKQPGFVLIAVLTLALGIGANTAIFSVVNAVLLKPLPYAEAERLVDLAERSPEFERMALSYPDFKDWRAQNQVFENLGVYGLGSNVNLTGRGEAEQLNAGYVSADLFPVLRVRAALGRVFTNAEDQPGAPALVVLSHALWQQRFGGDPNILNQTLTLNDKPYVVIGVLPREFSFAPRTEIWLSLGRISDQPPFDSRDNRPALFGVARLKAGVTHAQARADLDTIAARLEQQYPDSNKAVGARLTPLHEHYVRDVQRALWVLLGAVGLVLLIACANVANLLLARAAGRGREMAIRAALGASRGRVLRQLLTEGLLLSVTGGALGLLLAYWGVGSLLAFSADSLPRTNEIELDLRVLAFTVVVSLLTGIVFGLAPAWQASRVDVQAALKETARNTTGGRQHLRQVLVVSEIALTLVLLIGAGLLLRSFYRLQQVNPGFVDEQVAIFRVHLPRQKYDDEQQRLRFYEQVMEKLRGLPGVRQASVTSRVPLDDADWQMGFRIIGQPPPPPGHAPMMEVTEVGPEYFRTMGIPLLRGRYFTEQDNRANLNEAALRQLDPLEKWRAGLRTIIIDEEFARRHWPNEDALGKQIRLSNDTASAPPLTVVGIVGHVKLYRPNEPVGFGQGYLSFLESPDNWMSFVVKTPLAPEQVFAAARKIVQSVDANQPIYEFTTLATQRTTAVAPQRFNLLLLGLFAAVALALAVVGIYGVMSYTVTQRTHELGLRVALGAQTRDVLRLVIGQGLKLAFGGVALGLLLALAVTRWLKSLLFNIGATDPLTFVALALLLMVAALLACWIPARRATKVDPMIALRSE